MRRGLLAGVVALGLLVGAAGPGQAAGADPFRAPSPPVEGLGQWGLRQVGAPDAWSRSRGAGAVIAVVDTGVDLGHPDLKANLVTGRTFVDCGDGGCGNGAWQPSDDPLATPQHGTHVAGIAAAVAGNGKGIAGVAPRASILPINVFDGAGASSTDVARGIRWAIRRGADVVNLSLGDLPVYGQLAASDPSDPLAQALRAANQAGVVVVAAAGNETFPLCDSPAFADGILCVAATDSNELPADYSNLPVKPDGLVVRAPGGGSADYATRCGGGVVSTVPAGFGDEFCGYDKADPALRYQELMGTSMAAPHVAGVAALLRSMGCNRAETLELLVSTARNPVTGERGGSDPAYGAGIVDAAAATAAARRAC